MSAAASAVQVFQACEEREEREGQGKAGEGSFRPTEANHLHSRDTFAGPWWSLPLSYAHGTVFWALQTTAFGIHFQVSEPTAGRDSQGRETMGTVGTIQWGQGCARLPLGLCNEGPLPFPTLSPGTVFFPNPLIQLALLLWDTVSSSS